MKNDRTCPVHGLTEHTTPPARHALTFCRKCLALAVTRHPGKFFLTPEFAQELPTRRQVFTVVPR